MEHLSLRKAFMRCPMCCDSIVPLPFFPRKRHAVLPVRTVDGGELKEHTQVQVIRSVVSAVAIVPSAFCCKELMRCTSREADLLLEGGVSHTMSSTALMHAMADRPDRPNSKQHSHRTQTDAYNRGKCTSKQTCFASSTTANQREQRLSAPRGFRSNASRRSSFQRFQRL